MRGYNYYKCSYSDWNSNDIFPLIQFINTSIYLTTTTTLQANTTILTSTVMCTFIVGPCKQSVLVHMKPLWIKDRESEEE